jgi:hypothetical protein
LIALKYNAKAGVARLLKSRLQLSAAFCGHRALG